MKFRIVTNADATVLHTMFGTLKLINNLLRKGETVFIKPIYEEIEEKGQKTHKTKRRAKKSNSKKSQPLR